jgi:membrane protease YdiL (CAAX protease family)
MNSCIDRAGIPAVRARGVGWKIAALLFIYLFLASFFNVVWHLLHLPPQMQHGILSPGLMVLTGVILLGSILTASAWTAHHFDHRSLATVGVPLSIPWLRQVFIGFLVGSLPPCLYFLAAYKLGAAQVARTPFDIHHLLTQTLPALIATLLLAFHEELVYRGYLLQVISQKSGRLMAALITGVLFGLVHGGNSAANPQGLLFTAIGGVLLAGLVMRQGSLWMAGGYHAGWNATASLALGLQVSGTIMPGSRITTTLTGPRWLSGGSYGFEGSVISGLAEPVILGALVWIAPLLPAHPQLRRLFEKQPSRPTSSDR